MVVWQQNPLFPSNISELRQFNTEICYVSYQIKSKNVFDLKP